MIAVTGAHGYLGSALVSGLRREGFQVCALTRNPQQGERRFSLTEPLASDLFAGVDSLIHTAYDFSGSSSVEVMERNVKGSISLFESAKQAGVGELIFISSMAAFPGCKSLYGRGKVAVEEKVLALGGKVLRPATIWSEPAGGLFGSLAKLAKLPIIPLLIFADSLYLVHLEDVVSTTIRLVRDEELPVVLSIAQPQKQSLLEILRVLAEKSGRKAFFFPVPAPVVALGLRMSESLGLQLPFRSDSLVGLCNQNPKPELYQADKLRKFG